jgi:hypothetical protein
MGVFGQALGGLAGNLGSALLPIPGINGGQLGSYLGNMLPFARGGVVPMRAYQRGGRVKKSKSGKRRSRK